MDLFVVPQLAHVWRTQLVQRRESIRNMFGQMVAHIALDRELYASTRGSHGWMLSISVPVSIRHVVCPLHTYPSFPLLQTQKEGKLDSCVNFDFKQFCNKFCTDLGIRLQDWFAP